MAQQDASIWLVKSAGHVYGPFTQKQVEEKLLAKDIVVLDEVCEPNRRWRYIRDSVPFAKVVEELRVRNLQSGDDTASASGSKTTTMTHSLTEPIEGFGDDFTDELSKDSFSRPGVQEIIVDDLQDSTTDEKASYTTPLATYGVVGDSSVRRKAQQSTHWLWIVSVSVLVIVLGYLAFQQYIATPMRSLKESADYVRLGKSALGVGDYKLAIAQFKKAYEINPHDEGIHLFYATLLLHQESQTLLAKRLLMGLNRDQENSDKVRVATALGLADLIDGDLISAESHFKTALASDSFFTPALVNLAIIQLRRQDYKSAKENLETAAHRGETDGTVPLTLAQALIDSHLNSHNEAALQEARSSIGGLVRVAGDYYQTALLTNYYLDWLMEREPLDEKKVAFFLDIDPYQTELHRHNLFIYRSQIEWPALLKWCEDLISASPDFSLKTSFHVYCLLKAGRKTEAKRLMEVAVTQTPKDPLVQAVYAYVLQESGMESAANVAMGKAKEYDVQRQFKLPLIMQARFCQEQGDFVCSQQLWSELHKKDQNSLVALAGLASSYLKLNNKSESAKYFAQAYKISDSYRPLLEIREHFSGSYGK